MSLTIANKTSDIIVSKGKIVRITDHKKSSTVPSFFNAELDVALEVVLEIGKSFQPSFWVTGTFNKEMGKVIGWGRAWTVHEFFRRLGVTGDISEDAEGNIVIPDEWIQQVIGKDLLRLSYVSGTKPDGSSPKYSDWNEITTPDKGSEYLRERFIKKWVRSGYPSNFSPSIVGVNPDAYVKKYEIAIPESPGA